MSMEQKDYIVRQMELMGPAMMYMLGIWKDGRIRDAIQYGAENLENFTDLPLAEIDQVHQDEIVKFLCEEKNVVPGIIRIVGEFLYRIGEIRHKENHPNGRETLLKAKNLLEWYEAETKVYAYDIITIKDQIKEMLTQ
jgi:hypothetical protein